jgi:hypothetical protein
MKHFITIITAVLAFCSCIQNDLPFPIVELEILDIEVEGAVGYKYKVLESGNLVTSEEVEATEVTITGLDKQTEYSVQVQALAPQKE